MTTSELRTNRDLYLFIAELCHRHKGTKRDLQAYLAALWQLGSAHRMADGLGLGLFASLLEEAFTAPVPDATPTPREARSERHEGYRRWEQTILWQIVDLREMRDAAILANEERYFGVNAPSGARWYNFDPRTFLECGVAGTVGGWQPDDDTGRVRVPGEVASLGANGAVTAVDPEDFDDPIFEIAEVSWEKLAAFLGCGQCYE